MKRENNNYISLQEAAKYCKYSQGYLSLRARQKKLKAVKFGRNWVIKREWLKEYIAKAEEYNNSLGTNKIKKAKKIKKIRPIKVRKVKKEIWPPANLPIGEVSEIFEIRSSRIPFGFLLGLALILIIVGGIFGRAFLQTVSEDISNITGNIYISGVSVKDISKDIINIFREYFQWLGTTIKLLTLSTGAIVSKFAWNFTCGISQIGKYILQLFEWVLR